MQNVPGKHTTLLTMPVCKQLYSIIYFSFSLGGGLKVWQCETNMDMNGQKVITFLSLRFLLTWHPMPGIQERLLTSFSLQMRRGEELQIVTDPTHHLGKAPRLTLVEK